MEIFLFCYQPRCFKWHKTSVCRISKFLINSNIRRKSPLGVVCLPLKSLGHQLSHRRYFPGSKNHWISKAFLNHCCHSVAKVCLTLGNPMDCSMSGCCVLHRLPEFTQSHVHWVGDAIQPSHLLSLPFPFFPQSFPASESFPVSQLFTSGGQSIRVSRFSPSKEYSGLLSFEINWFDLLVVQWTFESLLQHQSLKVSIFLHSAFFIVQLWHLYMTTEKTYIDILMCDKFYCWSHWHNLMLYIADMWYYSNFYTFIFGTKVFQPKEN